MSTDFELKADYEWQPEKLYRKVQKDAGLLADAREDACVIISMEYAGTAGEDYLIQGYSFVSGSDNACYEKRIILEKEEDGQLFDIEPELLPRRDVERNLPDQVNVGLTGFAALIKKRNCRQAVIGRESW